MARSSIKTCFRVASSAEHPAVSAAPVDKEDHSTLLVIFGISASKMNAKLLKIETDKYKRKSPGPTVTAEFAEPQQYTHMPLVGAMVPNVTAKVAEPQQYNNMALAALWCQIVSLLLPSAL